MSFWLRAGRQMHDAHDGIPTKRGRMRRVGSSDSRRNRHMAATITLSVPISASPETVFTTLSESDGLASFWTSDSQAEPNVGSIARFGFPSGSRLELRVEELDADRRIVWTLLNDVLSGPRWAGTTVTWDLRKTDSGATEVLFQQDNWPEATAQIELAGRTYAWAQVLRALKSYAETGRPQPYFAGAARQPAEAEMQTQPEAPASH
jgi:uncharacterized protein YndB with AHSA1/START domain